MTSDETLHKMFSLKLTTSIGKINALQGELDYSIHEDS